MSEINQGKSSGAGRGGARTGAGRKPGSATKKTREIANKAMQQGISPLEVMLEAMREAYAKGGATAAFPFAKDAAPYIHAKISSMELSGKDGKPIETTATAVLDEKTLDAVVERIKGDY